MSDQPRVDVVGTPSTSTRKSGADAAASSRAPERSDVVVTPPPIVNRQLRETSPSDSEAEVSEACTAAAFAGASAATGPAVSSVPASSARTAPAAAGTRDMTSGSRRDAAAACVDHEPTDTERGQREQHGV